MTEGQYDVDVIDRLGVVQRLAPGWDGYDGVPVPWNVAADALTVARKVYIDGLQPPSAVPGSDGSVQLEWHFGGYDIELEMLIDAPGEYDAMFRRIEPLHYVEEHGIDVRSVAAARRWLRKAMGSKK